MKAYYYLLFAVLILACKSESTSDSPTSTSTSLEQTSSKVEVPPAIPTELLIELYENVDYIDFIFPNMPFSISQEDKASIQQTMRHINNVQPASIDPNCPYLAQQIFQENGEIVLDAKIFFQQGCVYYLFYDGAKPIYSASFTNEGIEFYNSILAQAQQARSNG